MSTAEIGAAAAPAPSQGRPMTRRLANSKVGGRSLTGDANDVHRLLVA
jgi:hypothetical protein